MVVSSFVALALAVPAMAGEFNKTVNIGDKAPDFSGVPATHKGQDTSISLSDIEEDVVVVVFLANHCPWVRATEDQLNDLVEAYQGKSVKIVGVSVNPQEEDRLPKIKEWVQQNSSQYVYGYDESQEMGRKYGATVTPEYFVLDKDRNIRYMGYMYEAGSPADLQKVEAGETNYVAEAIDALLAGKEVETKETKAVGCGISYARRR
jgi:peroxiredoxin